jgi:16S rRNA (guanine527-N7)-methyltransferase
VLAPAPDPTPDDEARRIFGPQLPLAQAYARLLVTDGIAHGHLGPREAQRVWPRHLVNSAVVADLLPPDAAVVDVGSGAGLPGLPIAIRRPDLSVVLVEPMLRRTRFLELAIAELELADRVRVLRGRAEDPQIVRELGGSRWIVARAVAPLDRLVKWCLPLLGPGGRLLAIRGASAEAEVERWRDNFAPRGVAAVVARPVGVGASATWVVEVQRAASGHSDRGSGRADGPSRRRGRNR